MRFVFRLTGDPAFRVTYRVAGDMIAYTLNIPNFKEESWPVVFETVISMVDGSMQVWYYNTDMDGWDAFSSFLALSHHFG